MSASLTDPHGAARSLGMGVVLGYLGQTPINNSPPYSALVPPFCSSSRNPHEIVLIYLLGKSLLNPLLSCRKTP